MTTFFGICLGGRRAEFRKVLPVAPLKTLWLRDTHTIVQII